MREIHQVTVNEKESAEFVMGDELQFLFKSALRLAAMWRIGWVVLFEFGLAEMGESVRSGPFLLAAKIRKRVAEILGEVETGATLRDDERVGNGVRPVVKYSFRFFGRPKMEFAVG